MKPRGLPQIDLKVQPASPQVKPGGSLTFSWSARNADRLFIAQGPPGLRRHTGVAWVGVDRKGREAPTRGELTVTPSSNTVYTFAARGQNGRQSQSVHIDVVSPRAKPKPTIWCQQWERLPPDFRRRFEEGASRWAECFGRDASVSFSAADRVLYTDENTTLEWDIACSDCAEMSEGGTSVVLVADATQDSGTRIAHEVGWGSEPLVCSLDMNGRSTISALTPGQYRWSISANAVWGSAAGASAHVASIPRANIEGANAERASEIERTIKTMAADLLNGCIRDASALDDDIAAFRDGWLNRFSFWARLLAEIENLNLITIQCEDVAEPRTGSTFCSATRVDPQMRVPWRSRGVLQARGDRNPGDAAHDGVCGMMRPLVRNR